MTATILIAIIVALFLIGMSAVFEMRALNRENKTLRQGLVRVKGQLATYKALVYDYEKEQL